MKALQDEQLPVAIIGGGLCGLYLAWLLQQQGIQFQLFESAARMGGRIFTQDGFDLGPTWYWPNQHPLLDQLLRKLNIGNYEQWQTGIFLYQTSRKHPPQQFRDPEGYGGAKRINGGAQVLIENLLNLIDPSAIKPGHHLEHLIQRQEGIELVLARQGTLVHTHAGQVVLTLPPRLIRHRLQFSPALDPPLLNAMQTTPTWMAGNAKAIFEYNEPFWRQQGFSGNAMADYPGALLGELFDASNQTRFALGAFLALPAHLRAQWRADLNDLMLDQLIQLFGPQAAYTKSIFFKDWFTEPRLSVEADAIALQNHPDYGHPWLQLDHWNDRLFFAGTETAKHSGGYMEGALVAAQRVFNLLIL